MVIAVYTVSACVVGTSSELVQADVAEDVVADVVVHSEIFKEPSALNIVRDIFGDCDVAATRIRIVAVPSVAIAADVGAQIVRDQRSVLERPVKLKMRPMKNSPQIV